MIAQVTAFVLGLSLLAFAVPAQEAAEPAPDAGPEPNSEPPNSAGAAAVLYGPNDWRIVVADFTVRSDGSEAITDVSIELQRIGGPRTTVFVWHSEISGDLLDETSFTYRSSDYPEFDGFRVSGESIYEVYVVARDANESAFETLRIARITIPGTTSAAEPTGTSLR